MAPRAHHCGVTVSDLERSIEFYSNELQLEISDRFSIESEAFNRIVGLQERSADIVFFNAGPIQIELLEYDEQGQNRNTDAKGTDIGVSHVCLAVDDIHMRYQELSDRVEFLSEPQTLENGATVVSLLDPDGNIVEFIEE